MDEFQLFLNQFWGWTLLNAASFLEPAATLFATFIGAWLAFKYQRIMDKKKEIDVHADAANRLLFQLMDNADWLKHTQETLIDPFRDDPGRMMLIRPVIFPPPQDNIDVDSVSFLISIGRVDLLKKISIERKSFLQALYLLQERSRLYFEKVNPALEKSGVANGEEVTDIQVRSVLGESVFFKLKDMTDALIKHVDSTIDGHVEVGSSLWAAMKSAYPKRQFIKFSYQAQPPSL